MTLLPLEEWLKEQSKNLNKFPEGKDYFAKYKSIKEWMQTEVFIHIGSGLSASDGSIYTSHGPDHFDAVIQYAGWLLGLKPTGEGSVAGIEPYEVYILLVAILLHDSGNMFGREGHEKRAGLIISRMGDLAGNRFEKAIISRIAQAHGGKSSDGSKDTIGKLKKADSHGAYSCRPKLIAAITRFADEICEDHTRAASFALENKGLPKENIIYHKYADSIKSVNIDLLDESIIVHFDIDKNDVSKNFIEGDAKSPYLIDEIIYRLQKMDCERRYIMRYTGGVLLLRKIKATIDIMNYDDHKFEEVMSTSVVIEENGHPVEELENASECPKWIDSKWVGKKLAESVGARLSNENK